MRYGRTVEPGFLPVYSVDTEDEARRLLAFACSTNIQGDYVARELAEEQTIENLMAFGERLKKLHGVMHKRAKRGVDTVYSVSYLPG